MKNPFTSLIMKVKSLIEFIKTFVRVRPVLTRAEAKKISDDANAESIFSLTQAMQSAIEESAKNKLYKATIYAEYPLDVFSIVARIFHGRGYATRIYRKYRPARKSEDVNTYYLEVSWEMEEKLGANLQARKGSSVPS